VRSDMELWTEVRRQVLTNQLSKRATCQKYGLGWHTLIKILAHDEPPGYRQSVPRKKPKLAALLPVIHQILADDQHAPKKQRHTAHRIFERLRDENGYAGGETIVKDAVREWKQSHREVFLPLSHPPGDAHSDVGRRPDHVPGHHENYGDAAQGLNMQVARSARLVFDGCGHPVRTSERTTKGAVCRLDGLCSHRASAERRR
jgi:transposase